MSPTPLDLPSAGGVTVKAYRWDPVGDPVAVVRLTHGMGEHALRYAPLAGALTARGYVVYAQDHRGHGATIAANNGEPGVIGADGWTELVADVARLGDLARAAHPGLPHVLLGHSMGSFATQQHLLDHSGDESAVVLTGTAVLDLLEPALDLDQPLDLAMFNAPFAPARTDYDWLSRDEAQVDAYVADPLCGFGLDGAAGKQMFVAARRMADPDAVAAIRHDLPVLVAVGDQDPVGGGLSLVHALVDRYTAAGLTDVTLKVYPGARHEVFNETNTDEVVGDVVRWIEEALAR
ncbi:alpha/beta fold hydrolase [Nocardioides rubriscoriae]|uniref:alpha/beta fold hydrolase n=1 Tax=Nocardioides rubriscoriae TaxID=642762 RepID=UPI0011DFEE1F|nr:alpha/beta hydrolase [Nocardioides rubriscoriae]